MKKLLGSAVVGIVGLGLFATSVTATEYEVQKGDNLWTIAKENNTSVEELMEINELDTEVLQPEQLIQIDTETTYIVERGDTLSHIAMKHGVTVEDIQEWNELETTLILIGEELTLKEVNKVEANASTKNNASSQEQEETPVASEPAAAKEEPKQEAAPKEQKAEPKKEAQSSETVAVSATAYTAKCDGCSGITATGVNLLENPNMKVIAVDPNVIPLGTRVHVEGYGEAIAADTGGAIKGNKIDVHVPTKDEAFAWGVRQVNVTILD
ncbi:LysM peptidoglycan-binding domain-containing protein [Saliterribacillus persicus]|uniref:3D (Asp-Asp-Asp) domain-containing protein n=1 Tax=Saliterribacillus persicus TaxID=930114 RepID=A0A368X8I7_9BACI|nr:3D domain-containing protein [Saliterribacillus persicus]RCW64270.1 3D (Asp-Asp-Asp) domain-containing protein [Saliterribacillus persicus]